MRHSRCEVRDHINYRKNDCCPSYRFCRALQRLKSPMRYICEIFEAPRFSSFSTQSAHDCQSNGPVRPTPRCKKVTPPQLAASYLSGGAQISMGSLRRATFVSGDRTPHGAGMTSSNSFWPPDSVAILVCLSSDDSTISRTRPNLCSHCSRTDFIEKLEQLLGAFRRPVFRKISLDWAAAFTRNIARDADRVGCHVLSREEVLNPAASAVGRRSSIDPTRMLRHEGLERRSIALPRAQQSLKPK